METQSPPVSPSVAAAILVTENPKKTSGTLQKACLSGLLFRVFRVMGELALNCTQKNLLLCLSRRKIGSCFVSLSFWPFRQFR